MNVNEIQLISPIWGKHYLAKFSADPNLSAFDNFVNYLTIQEGGLSRYALDLAASNLPPEPYKKDNQKYHTNRGWTWPTWLDKAIKYKYPLNGLSYSQAFYNMDVKGSDWLKRQVFYNEYQIHNNELINVLWFYIRWGGSKNWDTWYKAVAGKTFADSLKSDSDETIYNNMIKARLNNLSASAASYKQDAEKIRFLWLGAIAVFNREFSQFLKKK